MSSVTTIYANLAEKSVLYDGAAPRVFGLDDAPNAVESADVPCRILLAGRTTESSFGFVAIGSMAAVEWTVLDLFLIAPSGQTRGLIDVSAPMLDYCGRYAEMLRSFRDAGITGGMCTLEAARIDPGVYRYPADVGADYYGVLITLTIREVLSG